MPRAHTLLAATVRNALGGVAIACSLFAASTANAALTFEFNFVVPAGNNTFSSVQTQAIVDAGSLFSSTFGTHFSNTATLQFDVISDNTGLASAGQALVFNPDGTNTEVVRTKVITGVDANGSAADGMININLDTPFQYDPNAPVDFANGQIDLFSVIQHEVTHALGFQSFAPSGFFSKFDTFLTTIGGTPLVSGGLLNSTAVGDALENGAFFVGGNAVAAYGAAVPIEGPAGLLNHLGTFAFSSPQVPQNALMLCCGGLNVLFEPRDYNSAEVGILTDLGYSAIPIPEPSTYALMLAGLASLGFVTKRRQKS